MIQRRQLLAAASAAPFLGMARSANAQAEVLLREALAKRGVKLGAPKTRPALTQPPAQDTQPDSEPS